MKLEDVLRTAPLMQPLSKGSTQSTGLSDFCAESEINGHRVTFVQCIQTYHRTIVYLVIIPVTKANDEFSETC
jgi:hypothetical protein